MLTRIEEGVFMNYIKGTFIKEIYSNKDNGYIVGVLKLKETDLELDTSSIYFTGSFYNLRYKSNYIMYGEYNNHPKYLKRYEKDF